MSRASRALGPLLQAQFWSRYAASLVSNIRVTARRLYMNDESIRRKQSNNLSLRVKSWRWPVNRLVTKVEDQEDQVDQEDQ